MGKCLQENLADGTCNLAWEEKTGKDGEPIVIWDTENYPIDSNGGCSVGDDPRPGDSCESFQADWGNCSTCGGTCCECMCENDGPMDLCPDCEEYCFECDLPEDECECYEICSGECGNTNNNCTCEE